MRFLSALIFLCCLTSQAYSQSGCPYIYSRAILTPAQWNNCFQQKQDALGFTPLNRNGDNMSGRLITAPSGASQSGFNVAPSVGSPGSPAEGDIWTLLGGGMYARTGGQTYLLTRPSGRLILVAAGVNFNVSGDTSIAVTLPPGFTRFRVASVQISNASQSLTTATAGLFTQSGGGGVAVVTGGSAITVANATDATNNNMMQMTINNSATMSYLLSNQQNLYFRVATPEGAAATADVTVEITPLP